MPLAMTRPWKHPKTGVYWLRRRVPADIRAAVGKAEIIKTLDTKDPTEAKTRFSAALAELEAQWSKMRRGKQTISERQAAAIALRRFDELIERHKDNPSRQTFWNPAVGDDYWAIPNHRYIDGSNLVIEQVIEPFAVWSARGELYSASKRIALTYLEDLDMEADEDGIETLTRSVSDATHAAYVALIQMEADLRHGTSTLATPSPRSSGGREHGILSGQPITFDTLFIGWMKEHKPAERTKDAWERTMREFIVFVGHDDAARVAPDNVMDWKNKLVEKGLSNKTIRDKKLAGLRSIVQWGVTNRKIAANPFAGIKLRVKSKADERKRGYNDDEAAKILSAARDDRRPLYHWVPWICAFTGARISEVCQLRKEDVRQIDNIWCFNIIADAGSLKNDNSERVVPVHSALINQGLLDFVEAAKPGPLFADVQPDKYGRGGTAAKLIGRWVRALGIEDPRISPSHSWRHRLKTQGRRVGIPSDISDAITGHAKRTVADNYGEYPIEALKRELEKIPPFVA